MPPLRHAGGEDLRGDLAVALAVGRDHRGIFLRMLEAGRNAVHEHQLDAGLRHLLVGRRGRGEVDRNRDDAVRMLLDRVLDVRDLLVDLIFGGGDAGDRDAIFFQRVGDALHLQLRPVEIDGLHRDADLEMAGLHLGGVGVAELEHFGRGGLFAVRALPDDRRRSERREIDARDAARRRLANAADDRSASARRHRRSLHVRAILIGWGNCFMAFLRWFPRVVAFLKADDMARWPMPRSSAGSASLVKATAATMIAPLMTSCSDELTPSRHKTVVERSDNQAAEQRAQDETAAAEQAAAA